MVSLLSEAHFALLLNSFSSWTSDFSGTKNIASSANWTIRMTIEIGRTSQAKIINKVCSVPHSCTTERLMNRINYLWSRNLLYLSEPVGKDTFHICNVISIVCLCMRTIRWSTDSKLNIINIENGGHVHEEEKTVLQRVNVWFYSRFLPRNFSFPATHVYVKGNICTYTHTHIQRKK